DVRVFFVIRILLDTIHFNEFMEYDKLYHLCYITFKDMKLITSFYFIILSQICFGQFVRDYFFDDRLEINDSTTLVLLVRLPQTKFAQDLNHRIYTDTSFIRKIKESWFILRDTTLHGYTSH